MESQIPILLNRFDLLLLLFILMFKLSKIWPTGTPLSYSRVFLTRLHFLKKHFLTFGHNKILYIPILRRKIFSFYDYFPPSCL